MHAKNTFPKIPSSCLKFFRHNLFQRSPTNQPKRGKPRRCTVFQKLAASQQRRLNKRKPAIKGGTTVPFPEEEGPDFNAT